MNWMERKTADAQECARQAYLLSIMVKDRRYRIKWQKEAQYWHSIAWYWLALIRGPS
jgi:hypothetical protein